MERDCDERCTCNRGDWMCEPRCRGLSYPRGSQRSMANPNCLEKMLEEDECCRVMECSEPQLEPTVVATEGAAPSTNGTGESAVTLPTTDDEGEWAYIYLRGSSRWISFLWLRCKRSLYAFPSHYCLAKLFNIWRVLCALHKHVASTPLTPIAHCHHPPHCSHAQAPNWLPLQQRCLQIPGASGDRVRADLSLCRRRRHGLQATLPRTESHPSGQVCVCKGPEGRVLPTGALRCHAGRSRTAANAAAEQQQRRSRGDRPLPLPGAGSRRRRRQAHLHIQGRRIWCGSAVPRWLRPVVHLQWAGHSLCQAGVPLELWPGCPGSALHTLGTGSGGLQALAAELLSGEHALRRQWHMQLPRRPDRELVPCPSQPDR